MRLTVAQPLSAPRACIVPCNVEPRRPSVGWATHSHSRVAAGICRPVAAASAVLLAATIPHRAKRRTGARGERSARRAGKAGFGPVPYERTKYEDAISQDVGQRVNYVVVENSRGIMDQLGQYGFSQVDGLLGGSVVGYPNTMREEMKKLFDRGWFEQETEKNNSFKIGPYRITNQDREDRFVSKIRGAVPGQDDKDEAKVETQYEVAPTVVEFTRSLLVSLAAPIGRLAKTPMSTTITMAELGVLCGNNARIDRRVNNVYGWRTPQGFAADGRKLVAFYFLNPNWREEHGGYLQLEGVITPTGMARIAPVHDRLVVFWADKTVWSMSASRANRISEHQMFIQANLIAEGKKVQYDPNCFARWFPELQGVNIAWPPKDPRLPPVPVGLMG